MRRLGSTRRTARSARTGGRRTGRAVIAGAVCAAALAALTAAAPAQAHQRPHWEMKETGASDVRFRGLAAVSRHTAWVAGTRGTVLRTTDGGETWRSVSPPGAGELQFRDIEAFDARRAVVLAIGEGARRPGSTAPTTAGRPGPNPSATPTRGPSTTASRSSTAATASPRERPGGREVPHPVDQRRRALLEGAAEQRACRPRRRARPGSRPVASAWSRPDRRTCGWPPAGRGTRARAALRRLRGLTWTASDIPIPAGDPARGVFALAFRDRAHGLAVGGDFSPDQPSPRGRRRGTTDGGTTWRSADRSPSSYRSGVAWLPVQPHRRPRGRPHRHGPHHRRRPHLADRRHRVVRHRGLHAGSGLLGRRRAGTGPPGWSADGARGRVFVRNVGIRSLNVRGSERTCHAVRAPSGAAVRAHQGQRQGPWREHRPRQGDRGQDGQQGAPPSPASPRPPAVRPRRTSRRASGAASDPGTGRAPRDPPTTSCTRRPSAATSAAVRT